ncbi:DUF2490 domain-containing protein [Nonlabens xiamenensis]|uniref:DUF2490 domain-containing protein n=1 Tax=Nonlabens xiamenensis TaxID=2341043 RepID=UPI000F60C229|nr:DUF2490 domain-containing protein [Nonlabens xiamenensis]
MRYLTLYLVLMMSVHFCQSQTGISDTGLWSQYIFTKSLKNQWFITGDLQYRTYELTSDFQQFIARAGVGYRPKNTQLDLVAGYAYFLSGPFGESETTSGEHRFHQDIWWASNVATCFELKHRIRIEERFVEDQDFRSRFRYTLFLNIPLNQKTITDKTWYLALWNEVFINGETSTGQGQVQYFDRNWAFGGLGYQLNKALKFQLGYMREVTPNISKGQLVLTAFHKL